VIAFCVALAPAARAAVTHAYLPAMSMTLTEGIAKQPGVALAGPAGAVEAMTGDAGHVWLAERLEYAAGATRVDEFDVGSQKYVGQLGEEGGVVQLTEGLAVGHSTGTEQVYVGAGKLGEEVVAVYGPTRELQGVWDGAHTVNGSFTEQGGAQLGALDGVAVDTSGNLETAGDVFVSTHGLANAQQFNVVDVLKPGAGGTEGESVGTITGTCATPGACVGAEAFRKPDGVTVSPLNGDVLVADGNRDECVVGKGECVIDVFKPVGGMPGVYTFLFKLTGTPADGPFKGLGPIAVNASNGNIYVAERESSVVDEFSATGHLIGRLVGTPTGAGGALSRFKNVSSIGVDPLSGDLVVGDVDSERRLGVIDAFGPDVVIPDVAVRQPPANVTPHEATLRGAVNPDGEGEARCEFEYGTTGAYGNRAPCNPPSVGEGEAEVEVLSQPVEGLLPDVHYHYRLDASNKNGESTGECPVDCGEFTTPGPGVTGESAVSITATSASVEATVDPHGKSTSYYVQYSLSSTDGCDTSPASCTDAPASPGVALGESEGGLEVAQHLQGLAPETVYHYRVVAVSKLQAGEAEAFPGPDETFTTQPAGTRPVPADERQWELVSPADKHGSLLLPIETTGLLQAAGNGGAFTYAGTAPTDAGIQGYAESVQSIARRSSAGWTSQDISLPHVSPVGTIAGAGSEFRLFSADLSTAVVDPLGDFTSLAPCVSAPVGERTPYRRENDVSCAGRLGFFEPLLTAEGVLPGTRFGGTQEDVKGLVEVFGGSEDLAHVVLGSPVALTATPGKGETALQGLYEWSAGRPPAEALTLVSVLPSRKLAPGTAALGRENHSTRNAVSDDGSRVFWSEVAVEHLYMRDVTGGRTLQIDTPDPGCLAKAECGQGEPGAIFQYASRDGSRVFFTDTQRLTADAGELPGRADLYACEVVEKGAELGCELTDLTRVKAGSGTGADVQGAMLGGSTDGSWVYFVANGELAAGASHGTCNRATPPVGAECNLYVEHRAAAGWEAPRLAAVLGGEDWPDWNAGGIGLASLMSRVSGSGRFVAFMSDRALTGYDSRDAVTGRPDEEVFLYDAEGNAGTGRVTCASCDPTGARPVGVEYGKLASGLTGLRSNGLWSVEQGIAASVPGWTSFTLAQARYQPRYLADSGRLFFNSSDSLVPEDVNNNEDVYEYEPLGVAGCSSSTSGFSGVSDGCVGLISSGAAAGESGFVDASETGDDVFFLTEGQLVTSDVDNAVDLYDAHVCSAAAPCSSEVQRPAECTTADACRAPVSGLTTGFETPATASLTGEGELAPAARPGLTVAQKLAAALKTCRRKHNRHQRVRCEARARKRYPVKHKKGRQAAGKGRKR
jgi:hypothetical protein